MGESRARARTDSPFEHNVEQNGKASAFTMAFAPGSAKTQGILPPSQQGTRPRGRADSSRFDNAFGDRRVRLLTVNLNADESKPGSCAVRGKAAAEPSENREISQTCDDADNYLHMQNQNACDNPCVCYSLWANHDGRISATTALAHEEALRAFR